VEIEERIAAGVEFAELVKVYSKGPMKSDGGLYARTDRLLSDFIEPIPGVVRGLEPGEVSERVRSDRGWHFFYLEKRVPGKMLTFEEAQIEIRKRIVEERKLQQERRFEKELREKAYIRTFLNDEDAR
jgi:parvulin-like peptidyl-prolyl isomerase